MIESYNKKNLHNSIIQNIHNVLSSILNELTHMDKMQQ